MSRYKDCKKELLEALNYSSLQELAYENGLDENGDVVYLESGESYLVYVCDNVVYKR